MDFTTDEVSLTENPTTPTKTSDSRNVRTVTVDIQLMIAKVTDDTHAPVAVKILNSFQLKKLLDFGSIYPNGEKLSAFSKLFYPDKVIKAANQAEFTQSVLSRYSDADLRKTSWIGASVVCLVTAQQAEDVVQAFDLIKTIDGEVVQNTLGEYARVKIKERQHFEVPAAEIPLLKCFVKNIFQSGLTAIKQEEEESTETSVVKTFNILGVKRAAYPEPVKSSKKK
jgi:hypothetical protein